MLIAIGSSAGNVRKLFTLGNEISKSGAGEQSLFSFSVAAGLFLSNSVLTFNFYFETTAGGGPIFRLKYDATTVFSATIPSTSSPDNVQGHVANAGALNSQIVTSLSWFGGVSLATASFDTGNSFTISGTMTPGIGATSIIKSASLVLLR